MQKTTFEISKVVFLKEMNLSRIELDEFHTMKNLEFENLEQNS